MVFNARQTSIPVPTVPFAFTHNECTYILMERIHGQLVGINWTNRPHASRLKILEGLRDMTIEMRKLQAHMNGDRICSVTGGSLYYPRLPLEGLVLSSGIQDFHN
jgi:hypothetical protein